MRSASNERRSLCDDSLSILFCAHIRLDFYEKVDYRHRQIVRRLHCVGPYRFVAFVRKFVANVKVPCQILRHLRYSLIKFMQIRLKSEVGRYCLRSSTYHTLNVHTVHTFAIANRSSRQLLSFSSTFCQFSRISIRSFFYCCK